MDAETLKHAETKILATPEAAEFYAALGEKTKALDWLDRTARNGDERAGWFRRNPLLASIRNEPRFGQMMGSIEERRRQVRPKSQTTFCPKSVILGIPPGADGRQVCYLDSR